MRKVANSKSALGLRSAALAGLIAICCLLIPSAVQAQTPAAAPTPDPDLMTQEQILDELKLRRAQVAGLEGQVKAQQEQIKTLQELSATYKERGDFFKEAAQSRAGANILEAERDRIRREQIEEYKAEVGRLRTENDSLRRSRDRRTLFGVGAGFVMCQLNSR